MTLSSGSLLAQGLGLLSIFVLPRLYADADFGLFGIYYASLVVMAVVINGGYEQAVMLPATDAGARTLLRHSIRLALLLSGVLLLVVWLLGPWLLGLAGAAALGAWIWLVPLALLLEGLAQPLHTMLNRLQRYRALSLARVLRALTWVGSSIALGLAGYGFAGLIVGWLAGQVVRVLVLVLAYLPPMRQIPRTASEAGGYSDFLRYGVASAWLNTAARHLPFYLLVPYFGEAAAGQFTQANRVLSLPIDLIAMSIGSVFYEAGRRAHAAGGDALWQLTRRTARQLALLGLPVLIVIMAAGPQLFAWVLGEAWYEAGVFARWLMPSFYLIFIASPLAYLIDIRRKLPSFLLYNALLFVVRLFVLLWAGQRGLPPVVAIGLFSLAGTVLTLGQLLYQLHLGGMSLPGIRAKGG
ncbi:MAG: hypothetical protein OHK0039_24680 [Bacteroidia bacterium]